MRIHVQAVPWDIYLALGYAIAVSAALLATRTGNLLGLLLVVFVPGYMAAAALLPRAEDADWLLRLGLAVGLSFAIEALLGLLLNYSPIGITFASAAVATLAATAVLGAVAFARRRAVPPDERIEVSLDIRWARWHDYTLVEKGLAFALVVILAIAIPLVALAFTQPSPQQPYTELYLLGPSGNFTGVPNQLNVSQVAAVDIVVTNREQAAVNYSLRVDLLGFQSVANATTGTNQTAVVNETNWDWFNFSLADDGTWMQGYSFSIPLPGSWAVQFTLFRSGDLTSPYREVRLRINVP